MKLGILSLLETLLEVSSPLNFEGNWQITCGLDINATEPLAPNPTSIAKQ